MPAQRPTVSEKIFRQWLIGMLLSGNSFDKINIKTMENALNHAKEITDFMKENNLFHPETEFEK